MNFRKVEDVVNFLGESDRNSNWNSTYEHDNVLGAALSPESIDDIFDMITKNTDSPLIYESGCGSGFTTSQICKYLSEKGVKNYKLVAHDVNERLVEHANDRFSRDNRVTAELRAGSDYLDIPESSVDGIFSFNTIVPFLSTYHTEEEDTSQHEDYLRETSRVLKEGKPLVLSYLDAPLVLVKVAKVKGIPFRVKLHSEHDTIRPFLELLESIKQ